MKTVLRKNSFMSEHAKVMGGDFPFGTHHHHFEMTMANNVVGSTHAALRLFLSRCFDFDLTSHSTFFALPIAFSSPPLLQFCSSCSNWQLLFTIACFCWPRGALLSTLHTQLSGQRSG